MKPVSLPMALAVHGALLIAAVVALYPVAWVLAMAVSVGPVTGVVPWPTEPTWTHLAGLARGDVAAALVTSIVVATSAALAGLAFSVTAAWALARFDFPGRDLTLAGFVATQTFPGVVMAVPLYLMLDALGLLDRLLGLVLVYAATSIPFSVWTLKGWFDGLPKDLEEAAMLDGAGRFRTFFSVLLPLLRPALAVTGVFCFLNAWNEYVLAATLLSDPRAFTLPVVLQRSVGDYGADWGAFAAGSIVASLPVIVLFFALQKHFIGGLTAGAVKG